MASNLIWLLTLWRCTDAETRRHGDATLHPQYESYSAGSADAPTKIVKRLNYVIICNIHKKRVKQI